MSDADWYRYLAAFHDEKPGITERMLTRVEGSPYGWLVEPVREEAGWIVDVACGSAPTRAHLADCHWVGVDASTGELAAAAGRGPLVQARADALPFADGTAEAVCAVMALQVVTPLIDVLDEIARILRPGGVLVALVPARLVFPPRGAMGWARLLRALGVTGQPWPNPDVCEGAAGVLAEHGSRSCPANAGRFCF